MRLTTSIRKPAARAHRNNRAQAVSSPPVQKWCAEMMSVLVAGIQKIVGRTTVAEPIGGNASALGAAQKERPKYPEKSNANIMTSRNRFGRAQRDRPGPTAAIEDHRARTEVRYEKICVDVRAS